MKLGLAMDGHPKSKGKYLFQLLTWYFWYYTQYALEDPYFINIKDFNHRPKGYAEIGIGVICSEF